MRRVELGEPVAGGPGKPVRGFGERSVEGGEHGLGIVAVDRVRRRVRIGRDQDGVAGGGIRGRRIGAAVAASASAVAVDRRIEAKVEAQVGAGLVALSVVHRERDLHQDRVGVRVGDVVRDNRVPPARGHARDPTRHAGAVQRLGRRGHVSRLKVRERGAVGDDVLQRLDVRVVDRRVVDVAQHAVRDREPHLRRRIARGPEAVLAREVEVRQCTRPVCGDGRRRAPGARGSHESHTRRGGERNAHRPPPLRQAAHRPF